MEHIEALQKSFNALQNTINEIYKKMHDDMKMNSTNTIDENTYDKIEILCTTGNNSNNIIEKYLKIYPELVTYNNSYFFKLITLTGKIELVKLFIHYGANIHDDNHTILYICASNKYYDLLDYIISLGENIENIYYNDGYNDAKNYLQNKIISTH